MRAFYQLIGLFEEEETVGLPFPIYGCSSVLAVYLRKVFLKNKSSFHARTKHFNGVELLPEKHRDWDAEVLFSTIRTEPTTLLRKL